MNVSGEAQVSNKTLAKIKEWAGKLEKTEAELLADLNMIKASLQGHPQLTTPAAVEDRARFLLYREHMSGIRSPSVWFEGEWLADSGPVDAVAGIRYNAERAKEANFNQAVADGLIDSGGTVLDTRETLGNRDNSNYGKPLKSFMMKIAVGAGRQIGEQAFKAVALTLRGANAKMDVPVGKHFKYRANIQSQTPDRYILSDYAKIEFVDTNIDGLPTDFFELFDAMPNTMKSTLPNLADWHQAHVSDRARVVLIEGDVLSIGDEPNEQGNYTMMLADVDMDLDTSAIPLFMSPEKREQIDYVKYSRVCAIGRTTTVGDNVGLNLYTAQAKLKLTEDLFEVDVE